MGQSLSQLYIHLTFGTKNRRPFINESIENELHAYIAGILKNYESPALLINSVKDHIHILFRLSKNHSLSKIVEEVKKNSSKWIKEVESDHKNFSWQIGYGAFPVSSSKVETVKRYIANQKSHHSIKTFQQEVEEFMKEYDIISYSSEYFWR